MTLVDHPVIVAMLVNKAILKRIPAEKVVEILKHKVFPFATNGECVNVDFNVRIYWDRIEGTLEKK